MFIKNNKVSAQRRLLHIRRSIFSSHKFVSFKKEKEKLLQIPQTLNFLINSRQHKFHNFQVDTKLISRNRRVKSEQLPNFVFHKCWWVFLSSVFHFLYNIQAKWKTNETINQFYTKNSTGMSSKCTRVLRFLFLAVFPSFGAFKFNEQTIFGPSNVFLSHWMLIRGSDSTFPNIIVKFWNSFIFLKA